METSCPSLLLLFHSMIMRKEIWVVQVWVISLHHLPVCLLCSSPWWPQLQSDCPCCLFSISPPFSCTDYLQFPAHKRVFLDAIFNPTTTLSHNTECKAVVKDKTSPASKTKRKKNVEARNKLSVFYSELEWKSPCWGLLFKVFSKCIYFFHNT